MEQTRMSDLEIVNEGRKDALTNTEELTVEAPLRDRLIKKLVKQLDEQGEGEVTRDLWLQGNAERSDWLQKQQALLETFDEFVEPIYDATNDWSSTFHLPIVYTQCKTLHARFLAALFGVDPPFTMKARQAANTDRQPVIEAFVRYCLMEWTNNYKGVEQVADKWLWAWITTGRGFLKNRWDRAFTRYLDVVEKEVPAAAMILPGPDGSLTTIPTSKKIEVEEERLLEVKNCPVVEFIPTEDVLLIGSDDPQEADHVLHASYYTASELWQLVDQGIFDKEAVEFAIKSGESMRGAEANNAIKEQQAISSGTIGVDTDLDVMRYQVIERHSRIVLDRSGIASDIIMWVHGETGAIFHATYLHRVSKLGLRPFFVADFYMRANGMPAGLPELLFSLGKEIDAMHNIKMDFGIISSMPFGFYRASSSTSVEKMPLEPGALIPLDNPQADVYFPQLGARHAFAAQEEQFLQAQIERMTAISDLSLGVIGGQGAARTATGARALLGESNANLDIYLKRMNRGWKAMLQHFFSMLVDRVPDGMQFRILGDDGNEYWEQIQNRDQLRGMWDFQLEGNSANSNKSVTIEQATTILQTVSNPLYLQLGISNPVTVYNAIKNLFVQQGIKDYSKYIQKPQGQERQYSPEEIANSVLAGIDIKLSPMSDLKGFLEYFDYIVSHDELLGYFSQEQTLKLAQKAQEAQQLLQAIEAQAAQQRNQAQQQMNASALTSPSPSSQGMASAQEAPPQAAGQ